MFCNSETRFDLSADISMGAWGIPPLLPIPPWRSLETFLKSVCSHFRRCAWLMNVVSFFIMPNKSGIQIYPSSTHSSLQSDPQPCLSPSLSRWRLRQDSFPAASPQGCVNSQAQWGKLRDNPASLCISSPPRGQGGALAKSFLWFKHSFCWLNFFFSKKELS